MTIQIASQGAFGNFASNSLSASQSNGNQIFEQRAAGQNGSSNFASVFNGSAGRTSTSVLQVATTVSGRASNAIQTNQNTHVDESFAQAAFSRDGSSDNSVSEVRRDPRSYTLAQDARANTSASNSSSRTDILVSARTEQFAAAANGPASNSSTVVSRSGTQMASSISLQGAVAGRGNATNSLNVSGAANMYGEQSSVALNGNANNVATMSRVSNGTLVQNAVASGTANNTVTFTT